MKYIRSFLSCKFKWISLAWACVISLLPKDNVKNSPVGLLCDSEGRSRSKPLTLQVVRKGNGRDGELWTPDIMSRPFAVHIYICTRIQVGDHGLESIIIVSVNDCIVRAFGGAVGPEGLVIEEYIKYLFTCMSDQ